MGGWKRVDLLGGGRPERIVKTVVFAIFALAWLGLLLGLIGTAYRTEALGVLGPIVGGWLGVTIGIRHA